MRKRQTDCITVIQEIGIEDLTFEENVLRKEEKERLLQEFSNME